MNTASPKHSVSVAAVITDDHGRALLIQRADNGHWEPPGGVLELGETIEDGLRREVREETGLDVEPDQADRRLQEHDPRHHRPGLPLPESLAVASSPPTKQEPHGGQLPTRSGAWRMRPTPLGSPMP